MEKLIITICASKDSFGAYAENCEGIYGAGDTVAATREISRKPFGLLRNIIHRVRFLIY